MPTPTVKSILKENQLDRDRELAKYSGRKLKDIKALPIGVPESLRINVAGGPPHLKKFYIHQGGHFYLRKSP